MDGTLIGLGTFVLGYNILFQRMLGGVAAGWRMYDSSSDAVTDVTTGANLTALGNSTILGGLAYADVASASTTDIGAVNSEKVRITGTTTITGLGTVAAGTRTIRTDADPIPVAPVAPARPKPKPKGK